MDGERTFHYRDPKFLNDFVMRIPDRDCKLSVLLSPNILEFIIKMEKLRIFNDENLDFPELGDNYRLRYVLTMLPLCETHGIIPFQALVFNGTDSEEGLVGKVKHFSPEEYVVGREMHQYLINPARLARSGKWYGVNFNSFKGEENIQRAKVAMAEFVRQGYVVTGIWADISPYVRSGYYVDYIECKAKLEASRGDVSIKGDIPENFDLERINARPVIDSPQQRQLLEDIVQKILDANSKLVQ